MYLLVFVVVVVVAGVVVAVAVVVVVGGKGPRPQKKMLPPSPTLKIMKTMKTNTWNIYVINWRLSTLFFSY